MRCCHHIPSCSLGWQQSEVSCLLHQSLFKQRNCISFFECESDHQTKTCPPTHCFEQEYIPHIPGTFISALTQRPTRLAAECQSPISLPAGVLRFLNWSSSLLYTCDLISASLFFFVSREANVAFRTSEISAGDILMTRPLFGVSSSSVRSPWRAAGWLGTLKGEDQSPCGRHRGLRKGDVKGREMKRRRETAGKH